MVSYALRKAMSGDEGEYLWVTLGFASPRSQVDVLHLVVSKGTDAQDDALEMDGVYFEREDQAFSCYKGADFIRAAADALHVGFNAKGCARLEFSEAVEFTQCGAVQGYKQVLDTLRQMAREPYGATISIHDEGIDRAHPNPSVLRAAQHDDED